MKNNVKFDSEKNIYMVELTPFATAIMDRQAFEKADLFPNKWELHNGYVRGRITKNKKTSCYYLHRWLLDLEEGDEREGDHIFRNKLDYRMENLRIVTRAENCQNKNCKGYYWQKDKQQYRVRIMVNGKYIHVGYAVTEEQAAAMYLEAKLKYHPFFKPEV